MAMSDWKAPVPVKLIGFSSVATLLLLVAAVSGIIGWCLEATGTEAHYGNGSTTYTGLSLFYEVTLLLVGIVAILWLLSLKKSSGS